MTAQHDLDQQLTAFLRDGPTQLPDASFDAVRDRTEQTRQRVVIGPWRAPTVSKLVPLGLGAAAVIAVLLIGTRFIGSPSSNVGGAPSAGPTASPSLPPIGGTVQYQIDGEAATTEVTAVADGSTVSGTAVTTFSGLTHTVGLECAVDYGDTWAFAGTTEQTTVPDEVPGAWSMVLVEDGSPQKIAIVFSIGKGAGEDCDSFVGNFSGWDRSALSPAESGALVPPPDLAP
jgi:hypothetical protein